MKNRKTSFIIILVQSLVGHKNPATTQGYLDNVDSKKVDTANRITLKRGGQC